MQGKLWLRSRQHHHAPPLQLAPMTGRGLEHRGAAASDDLPMGFPHYSVGTSD